MDLKGQSALLRILALMASADGSVGSQEQQMVQRHFDGHFLGSFPDAWEEALTNSMDLKTASLAVPVGMRPLTIKLSYMVISACGDERGFPIDPTEIYAFNALVNHMELTENDKELAVNAAKQELKASSAIWLKLKSQLTKHIGQKAAEEEQDDHT